MPKTTISVNFSGKDGGLSNLFNKLSSAVTKLDKELTSLDNTLARVDSRLKNLQSTSGFLSSIGSKMSVGGSSSGGGLIGGILGNVGNINSITGRVSSMFTAGISRAASFVGSAFSGIVGTVRSAITNSYQSITGFITYVDKAILMFGNSIRQIAQGIQSFGISFSLFVSAPLGKMLSTVISESVEYDDALVKIRKTTEASTADIDKLGESLTQLSLGLPETRQELAAIAEDWGAVGITIENDGAVKNMTELVRLTAMLSSSTRGLSPSDAVEKLGKFAAIYYPDVSQFVGEAEKLFSVISKLEDVTPLDAGDILATAQRMAPVTKALDIAPEKALALAAALASVNASAERAGTQGATALNTMVVKTDKVAELFGVTEDKVKSLMSDSPEDFFLTIASSIAAIEDPLERVRETQAVFGSTGGKAVGSLAGSMENVANIMAIANDEFQKGTYLQFQFNAALESTKNQLAILKNNLTYAGSAIGDAFLPYITKFVVLAVPAIQLLTNWFRQLDEGVKVQIVLWGALLTIAGPVVVFFSSLLFMVGLTISGLSSMFGVVMMIVKGLVGFGGIILGLLNPINLLIAGLAGVAIYSMFLANDLLMAQGIIQSYIAKAYQWGYNLIASFADGISAAAGAAYNAVMSVINAFIGLIQSFSPPREGPLQNIDTWGENLIITYADSMISAADATVSAVSYISDQLAATLDGMSGPAVKTFTDAFNGIKSIINTVGQHIGSTATEINGRISGAAQAVANFIANLQSGVPDDLSEIYGYLGGLGERYEELIRLQNAYSDGETRLKQIQAALKGINGETESLIANVVSQTGLSEDQQAAMIRRIKLEQSAKETSLKREEDNLQSQQDKLKDDIDKKQQIIDALESLIFPSDTANGGTDKTDKPSKPDKGDGITPIDMVPFDPNTGGALDRLKEKFDDAGKGADTFTEKLGKAKATIEGLVAGLRGDDPKLYQAMPESFWKGFEKGKSIRDSVIEFLKKFDAFVRSLGTIQDTIKDGGVKFLLGLSDGGSGKGLNWDAIAFLGVFAGALYVLGYIAGNVGQKVQDLFNYLFTKQEGSDELTPFEVLIDRISKAYTAFVEGFKENTKDIDWQSFGSAVLTIAGALGLVATDANVWKAIGQSLGAILTTATELIIKFARLIHIVALIFGAEDEQRFKDMYSSLKTATDKTDDFWSSADKVLKAFKDIKDMIQEVSTLYDNFMSIFTGKTDQDPAPQAGGGGQGGFGDGSLKDHRSSTGGMYDKGKSSATDFKDGFVDGLAEASAKITESIQNAAGVGGTGASESVKASGALTGGDYLLGAQGTLMDGDIITKVFNNLITSVVNWATGNKDAINTEGGTFGQHYIDGTGNLFSEQTEPNVQMDKLTTAVSLWETTNRPIIEEKGKRVGRDIVKGTGDITGTDTSYMDSGVWAMWNWINTQWQRIVDVGKSWGSAVIDGIKVAFTGAGDAIWGALKGSLDWVYKQLPDWFLILIGRKPSTPTKEEDQKKKGKSSANQSNSLNKSNITVPTTIINNQPNMIININIDNSNGGKMTKDDAKNMADTVYKRLIQDGRLLR